MKRIKNEYINVLVKMSFPILMNYIVVTLFEVLDKAIVGNYSLYDFAAVGVAATVIYKITGSLGVISVAYNIIAAKYIGKDDKNKFNNTFYTIMCVSFIVGMVVIFLSILWIIVLAIKFKLVGVYIGLVANNLVLAIVYYLKIKKSNFKEIFCRIK